MYQNTKVEDGFFGELTYDFREEDIVFTPMGREVVVDKVVRNIDDDTIFLRLLYETNFGLQEKLFKRSELVSAPTKLLDLGVDVFPHSSSNFLKSIQQQEINAETLNIHTKIGWDYYDEGKIFKSLNVLPSDNVISTYNGEKNIKPKGEYNAWLNMVKENILGTNLELALVIGLVGCVCAYFDDDVSNESIVTVVSGATSTGKSTFGLFSLSCCSDSSSIAKSEFSINLNSTLNYILKMVEGNHGYCTLFDDTSACSIKYFDEFIYYLNTGQQRGRLTSNSEIKKTENFKSSFVITSETPLPFKNNKKGTAVRYLQFDNVVWTKSAEHSEKIKKIISSNSGHALLKMVQLLLTKDYNQILVKLDEYKKVFIDKAKSSNPLLRRLSTKVGIILLTANLIEEAMDIKLDMDNLISLIVDNNSLEEVDEVNEAWCHILEVVQTKYNNFIKFKGNENNQCIELPTNNIIGSIDTDKNEIIFLKNEFESIMKKNGFENIKLILRGLKESNKMITYDSRLTCKRKLYKSSKLESTLVYVFVFDPYDNPFLEEKVEVPVKKKEYENMRVKDLYLK